MLNPPGPPLCWVGSIPRRKSFGKQCRAAAGKEQFVKPPFGAQPQGKAGGRVFSSDSTQTHPPLLKKAPGKQG